MNLMEYNNRFYNARIKVDENKDLQHFRMGGEKNGIRRYQNLDGSLTPLGRIHYGVGMSREEMAAAREAEDRRQQEIDERRGRSIREMTNDELYDAVQRSRNEALFEKNMMDRSTAFLQNRNTEEQLNMEYEEMKYQQSRLKAERFMGRIERLARFGGNLASAYGKLEDARAKSEQRRALANIADKEQYLAEQQRTKLNKGEWEFRKDREGYERALKERTKQIDQQNKAARDQEKADRKAEKAAVKQAKKEAKEAKKASKEKPEYIRKEGDRYIYSDSTKSKWQSVKDKIAERKDAKAAEKRAALKRQTLEEIRTSARDRNGTNINSNWSYFGQKSAKEAKKQALWDSVHRNTTVDRYTSPAREKHKKMRKR